MALLFYEFVCIFSSAWFPKAETRRYIKNLKKKGRHVIEEITIKNGSHILLESANFRFNSSSRRATQKTLKHSECFPVYVISCHSRGVCTCVHVAEENLEIFVVKLI